MVGKCRNYEIKARQQVLSKLSECKYWLKCFKIQEKQIILKRKIMRLQIMTEIKGNSIISFHMFLTILYYFGVSLLIHNFKH